MTMSEKFSFMSALPTLVHAAFAYKSGEHGSAAAGAAPSLARCRGLHAQRHIGSQSSGAD
jgi:hypothetical protein